MPGSGGVPLAYCVLGHGLKSLLCGVIGYKGAGVKERVTMWVKVEVGNCSVQCTAMLSLYREIVAPGRLSSDGWNWH